MSVTDDAGYLLNNEAFKESLETCRAQALQAALSCDAKDDEGRRRYLDAIRTVDKVKAHLAALIVTDTPSTLEIADFYAERSKRRLFGLLSPTT